MAALAVCLVSLRGPTYESTAQIQINVAPSSSVQLSTLTSDEATRVLATQRDILLGDDVMAAAAQRLNASPTAVRQQVAVTASQDSDVLMITGSAPTPEGAQTIASAVSESFIALNEQTEQQNLIDQADALDNEISSLSETLKSLTATDPASTARRGALSARYGDLITQQQALRAQATAFKGDAKLITAAQSDIKRSSVGVLTAGVLGAGLGLFVCVAFVLLARWRPDEDALGAGDGPSQQSSARQPDRLLGVPEPKANWSRRVFGLE